jgi:hypothetical protein
VIGCGRRCLSMSQYLLSVRASWSKAGLEFSVEKRVMSLARKGVASSSVEEEM